MVSKYILMAIVFSGLVTWIPRMIPFILVKYKGLPAIVERFLKFLPVSIIFALILSSVVTGKVGSLPQIKWLDFLAVFPTAWGSLSLPQPSGYGSFRSGLDRSLASGLLVSHKKNLSPR